MLDEIWYHIGLHYINSRLHKKQITQISLTLFLLISIIAVICMHYFQTYFIELIQIYFWIVVSGFHQWSIMV